MLGILISISIIALKVMGKLSLDWIDASVISAGFLALGMTQTFPSYYRKLEAVIYGLEEKIASLENEIRELQQRLEDIE